ncbi:MAG TPA: MFS transporter [Allosphingosinicella sp.]
MAILTDSVPEELVELNKERVVRKAAAISLVSSSIEFYDFFLYGVAAAIIFPKVFFSGELPPLVALLAAFATFAVGFVARPVGGIVFGHFGDTLGRKGALVTALLMMGIATALIGCLPPYSSIGALAPTMLIVLRFVQGLALGGQWGGAMLLATENAPRHRRGFYGSFVQAGAPIGVVLANLALLVVSASVSADDFMDWGWRIPFLLSLILVVVALYVQLRLEETEEFRRLREAKEQRRAAAQAGMAPSPEPSGRARSPILQVLASHPKQIALAAGTFIACQVAFYILIAFVVAYGANRAGLTVTRDTLLAGVLIGALVMTPSAILFGALSDRYGRKPIFIVGAVGSGLWAFALFPLIDSGQFLQIAVAISVAQFFNAMMYGPQAAFFSEMFSTKVRYSGASLAYQFGAIAGGAVAPLIATALLAASGDGFLISCYIALAAIISLVSISLLPETRWKDLAQADA